jgi:hypothetical protein
MVCVKENIEQMDLLGGVLGVFKNLNLESSCRNK